MKTAFAKHIAIAGILIAVFLLLQSLIPIRSTVQIGADEGFEMAKATLCLHGYNLYSEVWNDQPPLHTFLVTQVLKQTPPTILRARLVTIFFSVVLLVSLFLLVNRTGGLLTAALTTGLVIASPGFLELSSSCMLEIPALATALAGLSVLVIAPQTKWGIGELSAGLLLGIAALMKLVPLYLLPIAALILWLHRSVGQIPSSAGDTMRQLWPSTFLSFFASTRTLIVPMLAIGIGIVVSFVGMDWLIERGAYLAHFQQSWSSHFGEATSFEYGSAAEHGFEWAILLKNWDVTVPAVCGLCVLVSRVRKAPAAILPVAWLALALVVFTNHKPWWSYYYVHIALPLCWCAAVGIESLAKTFLARSRQANKRNGKRARSKAWSIVRVFAPISLFAFCSVSWTVARVYLQVASIRDSPQLHAALVLKEIERLKPFTHWMYTDQLVYSFHADIPMPPTLAVVPLKRLWTGEMTSTRIASEMSKFKPEIVLLRNDSRQLPFQELLDAEYRMIYQDNQLRLYGQRAMLRQADAVRANKLDGANQR